MDNQSAERSMVGGKRTRKATRQLLGSHQKCWLWGRHVVLETLRAGRWKPLEVWAADRLSGDVVREVESLAKSAQVSLLRTSADAIAQRCGTGEHQGLGAKMPPFPYWPAADLLESPMNGRCFLILDALQDPYNFGAILRSAEVFAVAGVFVGTQRQSEVTSLVARSSAGAVNHVPLAQVDDLVGLTGRLQERGVRVVGATGTGACDAFACDFRHATALVIGNEATGVRPELIEKCDALVRIPQFGAVGSLNAAVAAGILLYEVTRQRMLRHPHAPSIGQTLGPAGRPCN
jgi:23S rRNA (guanosine2251-2'-O)-methyltransferase